MDQTASPNILIVDDDPVQRRLLRAAVESMGATALVAEDGDVALDMMKGAEGGISILVLDLRMPRVDGLTVMRRMGEMGISLPVIVQTGHGGIDTAVEAMRAGAFDFVVKPVSPERLVASIRNAMKVDAGYSRARNRAERTTSADLVSASPAMDRVMHLVKRAATSTIPVVIEGESGVGKEKIARAIQRASDRRAKPFVTVNCGAIPEKLVESVLFGHEKGAFTGASDRHRGKFVEADGGTLFLDEIGDLSPDIQVKLLRAVQDGEIETVGARHSQHVDVRLISATNKNLIEEVKAGRFREDLYYRLNVFPILVPPLRNRKEDIPMLVRSFADRFARDHGLRGPVSVSADVLAMLTAYDWPGNVRQLENTIFRAVVLCDDGLLTPDYFPQIAAQLPGYDVREAGAARRVAFAETPPLTPDDPHASAFAEGGDDFQPAPISPLMRARARRGMLEGLDETGEVRPLSEVEEEHIRFALGFYNGQMSEVARRLGIGRSTLYRKLKDYDIDAGSPMAGVH